MVIEAAGKNFDIDFKENKEFYSEDDLCSCLGCRNYKQQIRQQYPKLKHFFERFGVDVTAPNEISWGKLNNGMLECEAVKYIVIGKVTDGEAGELCIEDSTNLNITYEPKILGSEQEPEYYLTFTVFGIKLNYGLDELISSTETLKKRCLREDENRHSSEGLPLDIIRNKPLLLLISVVASALGFVAIIWQFFDNCGFKSSDIIAIGIILSALGIMLAFFSSASIYYGFKEKKKQSGGKDFVCRQAKMPLKGRMLLYAETGEHNICYRRIGFANQLIVDGIIRDESRGLFEFPHNLVTYIDNVKIEAGIEHFGFLSFYYIDINGIRVIEKQRRFKIGALIAGALLVLLATLFICVWNGVILLNNPSSEKYPVRGVDVSSYQGKIDWSVLSEQGDISFAFIKATEGSSFVDPCFSYNYSEAQKTDLRVGAYHFFSFDSKGETQAENFIKTVAKTENMLPPVIDLEFYGDKEKNPPEAATVRAELDVVLTLLEEHYSVKPIIYVTKESYSRYIEGFYEEYDIWFRNVLTSSGLPDSRQWTFWQYTNRDRLSGYDGEERFIDVNVFYGSKSDFEKYGSAGGE